MEQTVKCLLLKDNTILISEINEIGADIGDPNCKLTKPFKLVEQSDSFVLEPWITFSLQTEFMINSDSILTIADPTHNLLSKYFELTT